MGDVLYVGGGADLSPLIASATPSDRSCSRCVSAEGRGAGEQHPHNPHQLPLASAAVLTKGGACCCCRDREKEPDGMAFLPFCRDFGGNQDPLTVLVELDQIDEFKMLTTQIESARAANARQAQDNLEKQPRLRELQQGVRMLREGGEIEAAEADLDVLRVQKREREQRYDRDTLRRTLRAAAEEARDQCEQLASQPWTGGWQDQEFAEKYLEEKMRHLRREKLVEKLQGLQ